MKRPAQHLMALEKLHQALTASIIAESIVSVSAESKAQEALKTMKQRHFDVLGLVEGRKVIGYITRNDLENQNSFAEEICGRFKKDFEDTNLISESCLLQDCITKLNDSERLFVYSREEVDQIITRADLHKQPVRMLLFSVVSLLEMALLSLIRKAYPNEDVWKQFLSPKRIDEAEKLLEKRQHCRMDIDLADCLQLADKGTVVKKTEQIRVALGFVSKTQCNSFFDNLGKVRDPLAHGQVFETIPGLIWQQIFDTFQEAHEVLGKSIVLLDNMEVKDLEDAESPS